MCERADQVLQSISQDALREEMKRQKVIKERRDTLKASNPAKQTDDEDDKLVPPDTFGKGQLTELLSPLICTSCPILFFFL